MDTTTTTSSAPQSHDELSDQKYIGIPGGGGGKGVVGAATDATRTNEPNEQTPPSVPKLTLDDVAQGLAVGPGPSLRRQDSQRDRREHLLFTDRITVIKTLFGGDDSRRQFAAAAAATDMIDTAPAANELPMPPVVVMVVAMRKKVHGLPMQNILNNLASNSYLDVRILDEELILHTDVSEWPPCDALVAFYSGGYPLDKVEDYAAIHNPYVMNDLALQHLLLDRRQVYARLQECSIPVPPHVIVTRDGPGPHSVVEQYDDKVVVDGVELYKPFVMKPVDAEDHDIYVYFHPHDGGGAQHLFRKRKDCASMFLPDHNEVPDTGSYIFEKFIPTGGTDIKVYTVGAAYAHAEGRKAPVVDGLVLRDSNNKEVRCPILLKTHEKEIARRVVTAFGQSICGFDLLRTEANQSYVCDVNGFSFVKRAHHYYEDCATIMRNMIMGACRPTFGELLRSEMVAPPPIAPVDKKQVPPSLLLDPNRDEAELRCVMGVIRHGDRSPKQKLKVLVEYPEYLAFFDELARDAPHKELKIKARVQLSLFLERTKTILKREHDEDNRQVLERIVEVLERHPITGINRKVQMKPKAWTLVPLQQSNDDGSSASTGCGTAPGCGRERVTQALLIVKWGGEVTADGVRMAKELGVWFRENLYPSNGSEAGLLRLHSTYRHDLKIYSSDEGRVQVTAAAFAKGLLKLDGEITPILVSLVKKDESINTLLDDTSSARTELDRVKGIIHATMTDTNPDANTTEKLCPLRDSCYTVQDAIAELGAPVPFLHRMHALLGELVVSLESLRGREPPVRLYMNEPLGLLVERWSKLERELFNRKKGTFNVSKLSDIHDSVKYHAYHNSHLKLPQIPELFRMARVASEIVVPTEYGNTLEAKLHIAQSIGKNLSAKLMTDLRHAQSERSASKASSSIGDDMAYSLDGKRGGYQQIKSIHRHVRTRLYFTSESHLHALINLIRFGGLHERICDHLLPSTVELVEGQSPCGGSSSAAGGGGGGRGRGRGVAKGSGAGKHVKTDPTTRAPSSSFRGTPERISSSSTESTHTPSSPVQMLAGDERLDVTIADALSRSHKYLSTVPELNYLTQVVFRLYELPGRPADDPERFQVEILISPGMASPIPPATAQGCGGGRGEEEEEDDVELQTNPLLQLYPPVPVSVISGWLQSNL